MKVDSKKLTLMKGYHALPINISGSSWLKFLFFKQYKKRRNENDPDHMDYRTLIVNNIATNCTKEDLKEIFGRCGVIEDIIFPTKVNDNGSNLTSQSTEVKQSVHDPSPSQAEILKMTLQNKKANDSVNSGQRNVKAGFAHIIFESEESVFNALKNLDEMSCYGISENSASKLPTGLKKWLKQWKSDYLTSQETLEQQSRANIKAFEKREEELRKLKERLSETQDDEGWTVVAKKGKKRSHGAMDTTVGASYLSQERLLQLKKAHDERTHKADFYKFQKRESKEQKLLELRKKFEEDKKRIAKMRQGRKFMP